MSYPARTTIRRHTTINNGDNDNDLEYIQSQNNILRGQNQHDMGHPSENAQFIHNDDILQAVRWYINLQSLYQRPASSITSNNSNKNKEYDPYDDFLRSNGLLTDTYKPRVNATYINVDSRSRTMITELVKNDEIELSKNPLFYTTASVNNLNALVKINLLSISIPNHNFKKDDRVTISGIQSQPISIRALYKYTNDSNQDKYGYAIIFQEGSKSAIIKCNYEKSVIWNGSWFEDSSSQMANLSFDPYFRVGEGIDYTTLKNYDTSKLYVTMSGFTSSSGNMIGNVSVNFLNSTHRIYFSNPDNSGDTFINSPNGINVVEKITGFYILLPQKFTGAPALNPNNQQDREMVINMDFRYIGGIPINELNADMPISNDNINGYFTIYSTTENTINIKLNNDTYYINPKPSNKPQLGQIPENFGGDKIKISLIEQIIKGNGNPNNYVLQLSKSIHNIFMIKLVGTIFPNTSKIFRNNKNNKIYWQNLDDGEVLYNTSIPEGNYTPTNLSKTLKTEMNKIARKGMSDTPSNVKDGGYTNKIFFDVIIDSNTDVTTFTSFKEAKLRQPIQNIKDDAGNPPSLISTTVGNPPYTLQIRHPSHGVSIGDNVIFEGFVTTSGIPDTVLNKQHTIANVLDVDNYEIVIDNFNLTYVRVDEKGGFSAIVYVPNKFRLLFNYSDTLGNEIGFRNVGENIAITKYNTVITNQDAYQNEVIYPDDDPNINTKYISDGSGEKKELKGNALNFSGDDYILMVVREFAGCTNIGNNQTPQYFAKINLSGDVGKILYDTFVSVPVFFYDMINLGQLSISFYNSTGELYDFNGVEHSFVLEITSLDLIPRKSGFNSTNNFM